MNQMFWYNIILEGNFALATMIRLQSDWMNISNAFIQNLPNGIVSYSLCKMLGEDYQDSRVWIKQLICRFARAILKLAVQKAQLLDNAHIASTVGCHSAIS